jgi:hypothetical protein
MMQFSSINHSRLIGVNRGRASGPLKPFAF